MEKIHDKVAINRLEETFNRLFYPLCVFAYNYVKDVKQVEDIVQEIFVKAWESGLLDKNNDNIDGYLYKATRNRCIDFLRSKYAKDFKAYPHEDIELLQNETHFLKEVITIDTVGIVQNAIKSLPDKCGQVIELSIKQLSNKEIAEEMAISVDTVKMQKKIGYKKLRELLSHLRKEFIFNFF